MSLKKDILNKKVDCPKHNVTMQRRNMEVFGPDIYIDICPKCSGIWLDKGELQKILRNKKVANHLTKDIGTQSKSKLVCPRCGGLMDLETADEIEVDVCLSCGGVWLDKGELMELKEISKGDFKGDDVDKAVERWEEYMQSKRSGSFWGRLKGRLK